ncbi:MAG: ABC transporter ATP-binding protein, partial [Caulobacteraceae bacterium]
DEPTNDLDMDTLDLLEDLLADYEGTLILVSHDRDFIDRLATSTIALDGAGRAVETPGGWSDFTRQNPGFFDAVRDRAQPPKVSAKPAPAPSQRPRTPAKLSFKDQRRLKELEAAMPRLSDEIVALEARMDDAGLYARDPVAFEGTTRRLAAARDELAQAEEAWLELEARRETMAKGG